MSDFLNHLIDRALERGPRLERRKPSMFEASSGEAMTIEEPVAFVEGTPASMPSHADAAAVPGLARPAAPDTTGESTEAAGRQLPAPEVSLHESVARPRLETSIASPQERVVERFLETQTQDRETVIERTETRMIERHETVREPGVRERHTVVERPVERGADISLSETPQVRADSTVAMTPQSSRAAAEAMLPIARRSETQGPGGNAPAGETPVTVERTIETQAPTVTVSIGRVEIRAPETAKPAAKDRSSVRRPNLSLEDYLKHRSGGVQ